MKNKALVGFIVGLTVLAFQACKMTTGDQWQGPQNGTGYSGFTPEAGVYAARVTCPANGESRFENLTIQDGSDVALIENQCTQQSSQVKVSDLSYEPYRKDHVAHKDKIYEKNMPANPTYFNEALCDFSDKQFGILIRFYDQTIYHVGHIFSMKGATSQPVIRISDATFPGDQYGTGYLGENFELAIASSLPIGDGFTGVFNGIVDGQSIREAVGYCVTTVYTCNPIQLSVTSGGTPGVYVVQSTNGVDMSVTGAMALSPDIPDIYSLELSVTVGGKGYDCSGYVHTLTNEISVGGCFDRPTDGSTPKRVMVQVRGKIVWQSTQQGSVDSKVCTGDLLKDP